ncbi:uncharacterized protein LOC105838469 [Monomorium pharaonis]|uniref:uncharacterized protein LOC105838469 n=1 Tax=Monomorium pharaonis TaxID=307658 RepID=UPI00063F1A19|nr:uncharacterized protein LOC105838469 [Monomorium pharaonis]XP_036149898.1 uncharacterized protein LOC105838469 [Monomorium pharaonis]
MADYCPLCAKSGIKRRIKVFQINFEEALRACESEECTWPFGYEELKIFPRSALSCTWEEEPASPIEEDSGLALTELSLYTPPVTPGQELSKELTETVSTECSTNPPVEDKVGILPNKYDFITKESTDSNESPLLELIELGSINCIERKDSLTSEQIANGINVSRTLPKIISIEKTNINLKIISNTDKHDDRKVQSQSLTNAMDTVEIFTLSDGTCAELGLNMLHKTRDELKDESGELQSNIILDVNSVETRSMHSESETKMLVDVDIVDNTHSVNTTSESVGNISTNGDIDVILEDIINDENYIIMDINDDWLNSLIS